jgi:hypothetical protein
MTGTLRQVFVLTLFLMLSQGPGQTTSPSLSVAIDARYPSIQSGAQVDVHVKLTNVTKQSILIVDRNRDCDYSVLVYDARGAQVPVTDYQRQLACNSSFVAGKWIPITLKPGGSREDEIAVSKFRAMVQPGKYTVQILRNIPKYLGSSPVPSNVITITITP